MSKSTDTAKALPPVASHALRQLGQDIALARVRRKESQRAWADRIGVSIPTLARLEKGDPSVSMAAYATALWLIGRVRTLGELAAPASDLGALELDVRKARKRGSARTPMSIGGRLQQGRQEKE